MLKCNDCGALIEDRDVKFHRSREYLTHLDGRAYWQDYECWACPECDSEELEVYFGDEDESTE